MTTIFMVFLSVAGLMPGDGEHTPALVKGGGQAAHLDQRAGFRRGGLDPQHRVTVVEVVVGVGESVLIPLTCS
jgi:hypothetical protein